MQHQPAQPFNPFKLLADEDNPEAEVDVTSDDEDDEDEQSGSASASAVEPRGESQHIGSEPSSSEHRLQYAYTLWYNRKCSTVATGSQKPSYDETLCQVATFRSLEQFWHLYAYLVRPSDIDTQTDYLIFKEGVRPMWEDAHNKDGGKWIIRLKKGLASRCFEAMLFALLGEQFDVGDEICGTVMSIRFKEDILSVWNRTATDDVTTKQIRDIIKRTLNLPANTIIEYKRHTDSLKDRSSYRNTDVYVR
ncbi:hypothetical protein BOX15_Mlig028024g1 [Macrostomum lignano]|uniref:Eukaryotic translation initiation factor 4E type 2 n=3 Tax=Macrostomum lignano TaxID=282301 RepID=A0A1I8II54_9PLAT|nr:hypothetical protein BOX15_Mlig028024g1 [Macrostomum lignano]